MIGQLISAAAGPITGLIGGIFQRSAAKKAAEIQRQANVSAGNVVRDTTAAANENIRGAAARASDRVVDAAQQGATGVDVQAGNANLLLDPYARTGEQATNLLSAGIGQGGDFSSAYDASKLQMDPGYAFRLQEGQKALERSAAARGGATGGGVLKDLTAYSQGQASQEFQKAFDRFRQDRQDRFSNLNTLAGRGADVAGQQGTNLLGASKFGADLNMRANEFAGQADLSQGSQTAGNDIRAGELQANYLTGAGEAQAGGIVGGSNALWGSVTKGIQSGVNAYSLQNLLKNPAAPLPTYQDVNKFAKSLNPGWIG